MNEIRIVLPAVSDDEVSFGLVRLTEAIAKTGVEPAAGLLGGEFGYGCEYENDIFMMHPFCWCERDDCPWCAGCECEDSAFHYYVDGTEVTYSEWSDFYYREMGKGPDYSSLPAMNDWLARGAEVNKRRARSHDEECRYCRGEFGNAPNFLHKPSGSETRWYKYIGRSMKTDIRGEWTRILAECLQSLCDHPERPRRIQ